MGKSAFASVTNWGVVLAALPTVLAMFGINVEAELVTDTGNFFSAAWTLVFSAMALYGRWRAKLPLNFTLPKLGGTKMQASPFVTIIVLIVLLPLLLAGCSTAIFQSAVDKTRTATGLGFTVYVFGYQPVLYEYDNLAICGTPAKPPCKDKALYKKLYYADQAAVVCIKASAKLLALAESNPAIDLSPVLACKAEVDNAKQLFKEGGLKPLVDDPAAGGPVSLDDGRWRVAVLAR